MTDDWDLIGFVISSEYRKTVIHELSKGPSTPSRLADHTDTPMANISHALAELRERDVVEFLVDEDRQKGRVYGLTETGSELWKDLEERQLN